MIRFDRCIFELLARLTVAELSSVCDFIDNKLHLVSQDLNRVLAVTDQSSTLLGGIDSIINTSNLLIEDKIAQSPLLSVVRNLSPACGGIAQLFQGTTDSAQLTGTVLADALYVARQIKTRAALLQTLKNEAADDISALQDICGIIQLAILQVSGADPTKAQGVLATALRTAGTASSRTLVGPIAGGTATASVQPAGEVVAPDGTITVVPLTDPPGDPPGDPPTVSGVGNINTVVSITTPTAAATGTALSDGSPNATRFQLVSEPALVGIKKNFGVEFLHHHINLIEGAGISIGLVNDGDQFDITFTASGVPISVRSNFGPIVGPRPILNFVAVSGIIISAVDDPLNNEINILFSGIVSTATSSGVTPAGPAGGDLTGFYPNPILVSIITPGGPVGSPSVTPVITWDSKGRLTAVTSATISGTVPGGAAGGDLAGIYPDPILSLTGVVPGRYGDSTHVGQFVVDAKGRIDFAQNVTISGLTSGIFGQNNFGPLQGPQSTINFIPTSGVSVVVINDPSNLSIDVAIGASGVVPGGAAGGDLAGTYPDPILSLTGVVAGIYGDSMHVGQFIVDAKGRIDFAKNATISGLASGIFGQANFGPLQGPRPTFNFIPSSGIVITVADDSANNSVDVSFAIPSQAIASGILVQSNFGPLRGPQSVLNLIATSGISIVVINDLANNSIDVELGASGVVPGGAAGGDLAGTYPDPILSLTGVVAGIYGDSKHVGQFIVDAKGRIDFAQNATISGLASGIFGQANFGPLQGPQPTFNFIAVSGVSIAVSNDPGNNSVDVSFTTATVAAANATLNQGWVQFNTPGTVNVVSRVGLGGANNTLGTATASDDSDYNFANYATSTAQNTQAGLDVNSTGDARITWLPDTTIIFKTGTLTTDIQGVRIFVGYSVGSNSFASDNGVANMLAFRFSTAAGDTNWQAFATTNAGAVTTADTGVLVTANSTYIFRIVVTSLTGVDFYINGVKKATISGAGNLPATATNFAMIAGCQNLTAGTARNVKWHRMSVSQI